MTYLQLRRKCTKLHVFHSKWSKLSFWMKIVVNLSIAQLVTTVIFFSAWEKSRVKWDNSRNSTQKTRTLHKLNRAMAGNDTSFWIGFVCIKALDKVECPLPLHTVIFEHFDPKEYALSNLAFQSFYIFIGTINKKNFSDARLLLKGWTVNNVTHSGYLYYIDGYK